MKKDLNEELIRLEREINKLPEKEQQAICWIVGNFDFAVRLYKNSDMTDEEIGKYRKIARKKKIILFLRFYVLQKCAKTKALNQWNNRICKLKNKT